MCIIISKDLKLKEPFQKIIKLQLCLIGSFCIISQPIQAMANDAVKVNGGKQFATAPKIPLSNTLWGQVAQKHRIDPYILYAVALTESRKNDGKNQVTPSPWAINNAGNTFIPSNKQDAEALLNQLMAQGQRNIDIGIMQVNLRWNGHRVDKPEQLLNPGTNLEIGARVLSEAIQSAPNNLALGIGRYYNWKNELAALQYGQKVIVLADQIRTIL